jgi:hypothetical protein
LTDCPVGWSTTTGDYEMPNHASAATDFIGLKPRDLVVLPRLETGQSVDLKAVRAPYERLYLGFVYLPTVVLALLLVGISV